MYTKSAIGISKGLNKYHSNFGLRGVLAIAAYRLFNRPKEMAVRPPGIPNRVTLRMRTSDADIYAAVLLNGEYDFDLPLSPRVIVDVGANIGLTSICFARRYPNARIIAIEAEPSNFALLSRNARPYPSIVPIQAALWKSDGMINITQPDPNTGASGNWGFVAREELGADIRAMTMRTLMTEMNLRCIDLLKMDIEGSEQEIFAVSDWIKYVRCLMIELHDWCRAGCSEAVDPVMKEFSKSQRGETTLYLRRGELANEVGQDIGGITPQENLLVE